MAKIQCCVNGDGIDCEDDDDYFDDDDDDDGDDDHQHHYYNEIYSKFAKQFIHVAGPKNIQLNAPL